MKVERLGLVYGVLAFVWSFQFYGIVFFGFLTTWCTLVQTFTFFLASFGYLEQVYKKLLVVSWSLGWTVCVMFWALVYPLIDRSKLAPAPLFVSTHGGLNLVLSVLFVQSEVRIAKGDFVWSAAWPVFYTFCVLWPIKLGGITIYPLIFDTFWGTVGVLVAGLLLLWSGFYAGSYIQQRKYKVV